MMNLVNVDSFHFKLSILSEAYDLLEKAGKAKFESVVLFAGTIVDRTAVITHLLYPEQKNYRSDLGLMYAVEGKELHRINKYLYMNRLNLISQIHTHPQEAYHSKIDDEYAIITSVGGLSIVVPYFAQNLLNHLEWAYYRLSPNNSWIELGTKEIERMVKVI